MFSRIKDFFCGNHAPYTDMQDFFSRLPELSTERLLLRMAVRRDAADIYSYAKDPLVAEHVLWDAHTHFSDSLAYVRYLRDQYRSGRPSSWVIVLRSTGRVIGTIGYTEWNSENEILEVGYSLCREYWNQGYGTSTVELMKMYLTEEIGIRKLIAYVVTDNIYAAKVLTNNEFVKDEQSVQEKNWSGRGNLTLDVYSYVKV